MKPLAITRERTDMILTIKTTAKCQNSCEWCIVVPWMEQNPGFETTIENIKDLIKWSNYSDYQWNRIIFSGGEPLLWPHLKDALRLIRESGITDALYMYTNAMRVDKEYLPEFKAIASYFDTVIISSYPNNQDQIDLIMAAKIPCILPYSRPRFFKSPDGPVPNSIPAVCGCSAYGMEGDKITLCGVQDHLIIYKGWDLEDYSGERTKLGPNFLEELSKMDRTVRQICQYCFGNKLVSDVCGSYE
jgi:hypothetical protein